MDIFNKVKKRLTSSAIGKNIALITGGTAFAQIISAILSPVITRIYPPEEYGILSTYIALISILTISSSLDYQNAIPIADDDDEAINLLSLSTIILLIITIMISILLLINGDWFLNLLDSDKLSKYALLIPIGVFLAGLYQIIYQFGLRRRNYKILSRTRITQSIFSNATKIIAGLFNFGPTGLIVGQIIGNSSGIGTIAKPLLKEKSIQKYTSTKKMKNVLKKYYRFPLFSSPNNFVNNAANQIPTLMLSTVFDSSITGLYGLANTITHIPMALIGTAVSQVFYSEAAYQGKNNPQIVKENAKKMMMGIGMVGLPLLIIYFLIAPYLFEFVFGFEWRIAGTISSLLMVKVYFGLLLSPINRVLEIYNRQQDGLFFNVIRLGLTFLGFYVSDYLSLSPISTIALFSIINSLVYCMMIIWIFYVLNRLINKQT